jgi:hypothetical protein
VNNYTTGTLNGLFGTVNGTQNDFHGTIRTEKETLNGLHRTIGTLNGLHGTIRTENRTLNGLHAYGTILWCSSSTLQGLYIHAAEVFFEW